ncbi:MULTISPECIES: DUF4383 domain-containing protein [unclassified Modestobacter]|uniref:DUF4383 domain-containing protein n=1 Tax=unclassified Modestobacter TaxID=2643866 RepID=UPI0022AB2595|nr:MULTISPECIES: DUF4383 domain-containing protein [unclassified Modestobacter]MCZ2825392.1 DUF4383 domain-containing protein [Modestobacter sp. VKM Ac-2981]MCZ2853543.1 DUF4383 domain-containing protein [Modestobacter sp. VKM Ac-2982]
MGVRENLRDRRPNRSDDANQTAEGGGSVVYTVQRVGAVVVALILLTFGLLGFADGLAYFSTDGGEVAGLSSNGLLSTISVVTALVLVVTAFLGPRAASNTMLVLGILFLISALANLAVLETEFNLLAFSMANVIFSICAGLVLLTLGAYGRVSGNLPDDSPYKEDTGPEVSPEDLDPQLPQTPAEAAAEHDMREAELAVVEHRATAEQQRRVDAMARVRTRADRRRVWMSFDRTSLT